MNKLREKMNNKMYYCIMKNLVFILSISALFLFNSCDNETPSTVSGGGRIKFDISISPALKTNDMFQAQGGVFLLNVNTAGYSGGTTDEIAVTKGQNLPLTVSFINPSTPYGCHTLTIKAILNGTVFDTKVLEMGIKSVSPTTGTEFCKDQTSKTLNYIIP
jgi:hypothetical protein